MRCDACSGCSSWREVGGGNFTRHVPFLQREKHPRTDSHFYWCIMLHIYRLTLNLKTESVFEVVKSGENSQFLVKFAISMFNSSPQVAGFHVKNVDTKATSLLSFLDTFWKELYRRKPRRRKKCSGATTGGWELRGTKVPECNAIAYRSVAAAMCEITQITQCDMRTGAFPSSTYK